MKLNNNQSPDFLIKTAWHSIQRMYAEIARKNGITQAMGFVLISIDKQGSSPSEISKNIGIKTISLTRVFNELEKNLLITRNIDADDGRKVILKLTKEGIEARKIVAEIITKFNELLSQNITEEELLTLKKIIFKIESITEQFSSNIGKQNATP
jgi:DNA-binding MarR family transcriptional regulator